MKYKKGHPDLVSYGRWLVADANQRRQWNCALGMTLVWKQGEQ